VDASSHLEYDVDDGVDELTNQFDGEEAKQRFSLTLVFGGVSGQTFPYTFGKI
jgi:hypothetical protein